MSGPVWLRSRGDGQLHAWPAAGGEPGQRTAMCGYVADSSDLYADADATPHVACALRVGAEVAARTTVSEWR